MNRKQQDETSYLLMTDTSDNFNRKSTSENGKEHDMFLDWIDMQQNPEDIEFCIPLWI